jgi:hypothetical protein
VKKQGEYQSDFLNQSGVSILSVGLRWDRHLLTDATGEGEGSPVRDEAQIEWACYTSLPLQTTSISHRLIIGVPRSMYSGLRNSRFREPDQHD